MATWYTDVAAKQRQNLNFPGETGEATLTTQPGTQNRTLLESPEFVTATYTITGNEAANDIINICVGNAGALVRPTGTVTTGLLSPTTTLTLSIGDNDLAVASLLPTTNLSQPAQTAPAVATSAPEWISGATYAAGNVVTDSNSTPAKLTYTAVAATSASTAPHSAANTVWMPNNQRYANAIDMHLAATAVAFTGGTQAYGGPLSQLPEAVNPNTVPGNATGAELLHSQYSIQAQCWVQALIATINTTNLNANAVLVFRIPATVAN